MSNIVELSNEELEVLIAALEFIGDSNIGFEALEGYTNIPDENLWETCNNLETKLNNICNE